MEKVVKGAKNNILLVKDDVGRCKPSTRHLPPDGFAFGKVDQKDPEGAAVSKSVT